MIKMRLFYFICMVFTMVTIFLFSSQNYNGTMKTSDIIVKPVENAMMAKSTKTFESEKAEKDYWKKLKTNLDKTVRKIAHGVIYGVLGIFSFMFFKSLGLSTGDCIMASLSVCAVYACSDELHQKMINGRDCRFEDVCIDTFGAWIGVLLIYLGDKYVIMKNKKNNKLMQEKSNT